MKTGKRRRQQQQQSGRPVLVTFYVARSTRDGGAAATDSAHHHLHGGGHESARMGSKPAVDGRSYNNRRAELLEYSRHLRALPRQTTAQPAPPPRLHCRDTTNTVGAVPDADQPAAENGLWLVGRRHERARSQQQQQIRQRCFGGWSWKRVLVLVFPFNSSSNSKSKRPRRSRHDDGRGESNRNSNQKGWPAALLLGKLAVSRDHSGLRKKLISVFLQRS